MWGRFQRPLQLSFWSAALLCSTLVALSFLFFHNKCLDCPPSTIVLSPRTSSSSRWRLGIIQVAGGRGYIDSVAPQLSAVGCYAARHGYGLHVEHVKLYPLESNRWHYVRLPLFMKYLAFYDWLVFLDADVLPLNYSIPLTDFLPSDTSDQTTHVVAQQRENGELLSGLIFVRNSAVGRRFVNRWMHLVQAFGERSNWDNGDLHQLYVDEVCPQRAALCDNLRNQPGELWAMYAKFLDCFIECFRSLPLDTVASRHGIRVFPIGHGFAREFWGGVTPSFYLTHHWAHDCFGFGKHLDQIVGRNELLCRIPTSGIFRPELLVNSSVTEYYCSPEFRRDWAAVRVAANQPPSDFRVLCPSQPVLNS